MKTRKIYQEKVSAGCKTQIIGETIETNWDRRQTIILVTERNIIGRKEKERKLMNRECQVEEKRTHNTRKKRFSTRMGRRIDVRHI